MSVAESIVVILLGACVGLSRPTGLDWLAKAAKARLHDGGALEAY
ncbi:hypothetical protein CPAR01_08230 [Colletotrichum paranaense]|uniref:Uncharacterized protein n=5 Tax=Colletotrichum acutatum species complex TaxID=2707335 RepID=A0AAI9ZB86_9PEZI|nr:uncharacterized protein CCOS01_00631 [Colletotrichum costaricense]XP_060348868.1 uncharacterized protein CPAR01_08230 [Colletotrichum paranaense]XP_060384077.1 uncharacterized protein CTAM01_05241 [Colletotrichum tamarilloi]XP_060397507.1 uncharacterized protein CABS01_11330 [Colletotrichum abscissum]KAI3550174.1 hypothetical protein CSPX01_01772 [Colletotrichum filicis]KAK1453660.1 hypothetical protein CMEL01_05319 [Colletotrichum melonis]KAK1491958.1 hypothetical protein CCUS01_14184 [Co